MTYCFVVTNTGNTYLGSIQVSDAPLGIARADMTLLSGTEPLAPGASLVFYYETVLTADLLNTAAASGNPVTSGGVDIAGVVDAIDDDTVLLVAGVSMPSICHHNCPDEILLNRRPKLDLFRFVATFPAGSVIDPLTEAFTVTLEDVDGVIYDGTLPAGSMNVRANTYRYRDAGAKRGTSLHDGFFQVKMFWTPDLQYLRAYVQIVADMSAVTRPDMILRLQLGDDTMAIADTWSKPSMFKWQRNHR